MTIDQKALDRFPATFTVDQDEVAGNLYYFYYFALTGAAKPPYRTQRHVNAILDIAEDGTLAGVELIDDMPPPPAALSASDHAGLVEPSLADCKRLVEAVLEHCDGTDFDCDTKAAVKSVRALLAREAATALSAGVRVKIKPLEWIERVSGVMRAETILGDYRVWTHHEADGVVFWQLSDGGIKAVGQGTEAECFAAAQEDYERRIRSALSDAPVVSEEPDIALAMMTWMIEHGWLDDGHQYCASDIVAALNDNAGSDDEVKALVAAYRNADKQMLSSDDIVHGHRSGVRDVAVRLGVYDQFVAALGGGE